MTYDLTEDARPDPLVTEADVTGLYRPEAAALASQSTPPPRPGPTATSENVKTEVRLEY
jgi:hypothetical protein